MTRTTLWVLLLLAAGAVNAQHGGYAGQQDRAIKALSEDETKQYLSGAGMGYARAAELNGYPGPMHVLELADQLKLSPEQRAATQRLMETHKAEARSIGAKRVAAEKSLDELFKTGGADPKHTAEAVRASAQLEGEYRLSHLDTHLKMRALLSDHQVAQYNALRGYAVKKHAH
jgi:Spy/CpxP family protein refolding chaperone